MNFDWEEYRVPIALLEANWQLFLYPRFQKHASSSQWGTQSGGETTSELDSNDFIIVVKIETKNHRYH